MNEVPRDWMSPDWETSNYIHQWTTYVSDELRAIWDTFSDEQKKAIANAFQQIANREKWD